MREGERAGGTRAGGVDKDADANAVAVADGVQVPPESDRTVRRRTRYEHVRSIVPPHAVLIWTSARTWYPPDAEREENAPPWAPTGRPRVQPEPGARPWQAAPRLIAELWVPAKSTWL